jgi:hypothetical protein
MINGAVANVLDYGADITGVTDSRNAIQSALDSGAGAIYIPKGTYLINTALLPKTTQMIFGDGVNVSVLKAGNVGMTVLSYPSGAYSNVVLRDLTVDGDSKAAIGLNMIASGQGAISNCEFHNIQISNCSTYQMYLSQASYCVIDRCVFAVGAYGLFLNDCYSSEVKNCIIHDGNNASLLVAQGTQIVFSKNIFYNEASNPSPTLLIIDGGNAHSFVDCEFEPQGAANVTYEVTMKDTFASGDCTDNSFTRCRFIGLANTKTNCIIIGQVGSVFKTRITECGFIKPTSTNSISLASQAETSFARNYDLVTYDTPTYAAVTISNTSGNGYYIENLTGTFLTVQATNIIGSSYVASGTSATQWISGTGSPEGAVTAAVGSFFSRTNGGAGTSFYVKESGAGNTGWVAK